MAPIKWSEFHVNRTVAGVQQQVQVQALKNGMFVGTWLEEVKNDQGVVVSSAIKAQVFYSGAAPMGSEIPVSLATTGSVEEPTITVLSSGRFVVAWHCEDPDPGATVKSTIKARIFNADGSAYDADGDGMRDEEIVLAGSAEAGKLSHPSLAALSGDKFVATYTTNNGTPATPEYDVRGCLFSGSGVMQGDAFVVNATTIGDQGNATVIGTDGGFAVVFSSMEVISGSPVDRVSGRVFTLDGGTSTGGAQFVLSNSWDGLAPPKITKLADGRFVAVWSELDFSGAAGADVDGTCVKAQIYKADGTPDSNAIRVNALVKEGDQFAPAVTALAGGGFAIAYVSPGASSGFTNIRTVTFSGAGAFVGEDVVASDVSINAYRGAPTITELFDGRLIVSWDQVKKISPNGAPAVFDRDTVGQVLDYRIKGIDLTWGNGNDQAVGTQFDDTMNGGDGDDHLAGAGGNDLLIGGSGSDRLEGGTGADKMQGGIGNDVYYVDNAGDTVTEGTGEGYDTVFTSTDYILGANVEALEALTGAVRLTGNVGANVIRGNAADNIINGGAGADRMEGGLGNDSYDVDDANDVVVENFGAGLDTIFTWISYTLGENIENLTGQGTAKLSLRGNDLANVITGSTGADTIRGGLGQDKLVGGKGKDIFVLDSPALNTKANVKALADFKVVDDSIWLENAVFTKLGKKGSEKKPVQLATSAFWLGTKAHDKDDRIIVDIKKGNVFYDEDGSGKKAAVLIATLPKKLTTISEKDFFII
ncbi:calcium-binding protein [Microvirga sp. 2MCAF38]|uniref:calcium-binding protein n=1 Tax=Microvirga sp. 2MCAF38 TaxID=3232989 RepID=UPI003F9B1BEE